MLQVHVPVGVGLIAALGAGSAAWTARLESRDGSRISGTARVEAVTQPMMPPKDSLVPPGAKSDGATESPDLRVTITVSNAPAKGALTWHLHSGKCGAANAGVGTTVVGSPSSYDAIKVDAQGNGAATVMVRGTLLPGGDYYVAIHGADLEKLSACGNLEPAKPST